MFLPRHSDVSCHPGVSRHSREGGNPSGYCVGLENNSSHLGSNSILFKLLLTVMLLCSMTLTVHANEQTKLKNISKKITQLITYVSQKKEKKGDLQNELRSLEKQIDDINQRLYLLKNKIDQQQKKLRPLQNKQKNLQQKLTKQRDSLAQQIQAAYQTGNTSAWQLLLSQQDPSNISRINTYYQAINKARQRLIENFMQSLIALKTNQDKINVVIAGLQQLQHTRRDEQKILRQKLANRKTLLGRIAKQIRSSQQRITQLQANKKQLQNVVNNLAAEKNLASLSGISFAKLKHRLPWPTHGQLVRNYRQIYDGRLRSNGVLISAKADTPVRAIASGKVVFANWLRGYGNMVIVTHKGGYMTLYGHNNALLVKLGDSIKPGQEIALVGNSGGVINAGLYFEVRYRGQTRNPATWCR